jgi:hypothetical protein
MVNTAHSLRTEARRIATAHKKAGKFTHAKSGVRKIRVRKLKIRG